MQQNPSISEKILNVLNNLNIDTLLKNGRVYGGGLHKLEPKELTNLPLPELGNITPELKINKMVQKSMF